MDGKQLNDKQLNTLGIKVEKAHRLSNRNDDSP